MTLQEITAKMKEGASKKSSFGNTVKFTTDQGVVYIDGKLDGMTAFMTGKLKIEGDMGVAMKLQTILR